MLNKPRKLKKIEDEIWKEVPGSNGVYFVSNYGRLKSFQYKKDGVILKGGEINGFKLVEINFKGEKGRRLYLHKLLAEVWLPKPSKKQTFVTHLDGNLKNNHISNLAWMAKEQLEEQHRLLKAKMPSKKRVGQITYSKLKVRDVIAIKKMLQNGVQNVDIARMFRISDMQVTRIKRGENWGHVQVEPNKE
jgi:hypothetical protein